jgi:hypothetical protein
MLHHLFATAAPRTRRRLLNKKERDPFMATEITLSPSQHAEAGTRLFGRRLILARVTWVAVVTLIVALSIVLLPAYYTQLQTVCTGATCTIWQPTPGSVQTIQKLGLSIYNFVTFTLALTIASALLCFAVSGVIFWHKSDDWMALLVALGVVALGTLNITSVLQVSHSTWQVLAIVLNVLGNGMFFLVCSLFPNGRFVPLWTRWLLPCWVVSGIVFLFFRDVSFVYPIHHLVWFAEVVLLVIALLYRYHYASSPLQRQQTKWVIFGTCVAGIIVIGLTVPILIFPLFGQVGSFFQLISGPAYIVVVLIVPLSFGVAILRYRLWDIDILINRTLVYGSLTAILGLVYFASVLALQSLLSVFTGQFTSMSQTPVVIVASTLGIAALFQPLRRRLQIIIDRRFYRSKYDAARTLAAFSTSLRDEVDLDKLREQLLTVVQETMQPAHVSLWLRNPERPRERDTRLLPRIDEGERTNL